MGGKVTIVLLLILGRITKGSMWYKGCSIFEFSTFYRIDIHFVIKIADFGLSEDVYVKNYFRQSGSDKSIKLPVKWMAPESLTDGVFSEKSDVVGILIEYPSQPPHQSQIKTQATG